MANKSCVLITGTSQGLGAALAKAYLDSDEQVVGCSRGESKIIHKNYQHYMIDVSDEVMVGNMFLDMRNKKMTPRLLVNNAALTHMKIVSMTDAKTAKEIIDVNLFGAFLVCREALKIMQRYNFGRIINISSVQTSLAAQGCALYNATKAGLDAMGRSLANECKSYDITVNTIGLSLVENTGMAEALNQVSVDLLQKQLIKPEVLTVAEVLAAINFFASKNAKNITGQLINFGGIR